MNKMVKKLSVGALAFGLIVGGFSTTAFAATDIATETTVQGGSLSVNNLGITPFSSLVLNGTSQEVATTVNPFSVVDATGTGAGWNLNVTASQLTSSAGTLPQGSISISAPVVTAQDGSSAASTITSGSGNIDNTTGVKLLTASTGGGMGTFDFTDSNLTLKLQPKDVKAGTYSSTVTFNLVTGP